MKTEPFSEEQVKALMRSMTPMSRMIIDWDIDYSVGRGILEGTSRCMWTKKGHRITVGGLEYGLIISESKDVDPEYKILKGTLPTVKRVRTKRHN